MNDPMKKLARFAEGVSADPTAHMSEEDAAKWQEMNDKHRDKFKKEGRLTPRPVPFEWAHLMVKTLHKNKGNPLKMNPELTVGQKVHFQGHDWLIFSEDSYDGPGEVTLVYPNLKYTIAFVPVAELGVGEQSKLASLENLLSKVAVGDIPADVERYVKEIKDGNPDYDDAKAWATAWSRYCKYKNPGSEHCHMNTNDYFKSAMTELGRMAEDSIMSELEVMAEGCPDNLDEADCKEWESNTDKYKNVVKDKHQAGGKVAARSLREIARDIRRDWRPVNYAAKPYLDAMGSLGSITDNYDQDSGASIVAYFLSNATSWRGDVAKQIKAELKAMLKSSGRYAGISTFEDHTPDNSAKKSPMDPMATWDEGEIDLGDDPREHDSEGSMIPGLEDRLAAMAADDDDAIMAEMALLAEGCPDNLDEGECKEWEANTDKYKDVVKDKHQASRRRLTAAPKVAARRLYQIAEEIRRDWKKVYFGAVPYLDALGDLDSIDDNYGEDSGRSIVAYFLSNATTWRGPEAVRIKTELKAMLKSGGHYAADDDDEDDDDGDELTARYEEGVSVDPTKDMSEEDAKAWEGNTDKYKDKFKTARVLSRMESLELLQKLEKQFGENTAKYYDAAIKGVKDGIIAPAAVVGGGYKDGKKIAIQWLMKMKGEAQKTAAAEDLSLESQWEGKTAGAMGLYGFTKGIQTACEASTRKVAKTAKKLAKEIYAKDNETAPFLAAHAKRGKSLSAQILVAAMKDLGPKIASDMRKAELKVAAMPEERLTKEAARKYGLYGYQAKTASLGLQACTTIREASGSTAAELHGRKAADHGNITGFLKAHAKQAQCMYSKMLVDGYPDADRKTASAIAPATVGEWLNWED